MTKIEQLENQLDTIRAELDKLKNQEPKPGKPIKWMPEIGQKYYFVNDADHHDCSKWAGDRVDLYRRNHIGIFPTAEDCDWWDKVDKYIRNICGEAVAGKRMYCLTGNIGLSKFFYRDCVDYEICYRYWTNDPAAADKINESLTGDDRRRFLTGGRG
jgi:hypothetical protein